MPKRPKVTPPRPWSFPVPRRTDLGNGATVLCYDIPGQHVLSVRIAIPAPTSLEPRDKEGVASIMTRSMDEGTRTHPPEEMAELLERKGIALGAGVAENGVVVELDVPRRSFAEALRLLLEVVTEPAFDEAVVRRHVRTRLAEIDQDFASPTQRAAIAFADAYYDDADRRSRPTAGTKATVATLTPGDVAAYHARVVRPDQATIVVAGDPGDLAIDALVESTFAQWSPPAPVPTTPATSMLPESPPTGPGRVDQPTRIVVVDRPGAVQSELYVGCPGPHRRAPEGWAAYPVLSFVVGGSPNARLDAVLREDKGYTYGVRCAFRPRRGDGIFITSGSVRSEVTADALRLLLEQLERARDGFEAAEVEAGIDYVRKTAPGRYATADAVADEAAMRALDGLTTSATSQWLSEMADLTPKRLRKAYRAYVDGTWTVIVVGDASAIAEDLRALGRGEVTVVDN